MQRGHRLLCELAHLREASSHHMQHDPITGTFNREAMLTILFRETDRVQRLHGSLCLVLFAVDDFAYWKDEIGREACDGLLREIAARIERVLRSYDLLGRTGPDEFLLALPGCSIINAVMMAERIRMDVFGELFTIPGSHANPAQLRLTACFGVAPSRGRSPVVVLREAEQTLALSRQSGPDSISCAGDAPPQTEFSATLFTDKAMTT
jgi:diguanylate cyclase (GGDEF)-like protein